MALGLADWVVTEAGFAADLGAEKFVDVKCRTAGLDPAVVVVVATVRALRWHGGVAIKDVDQADVAAVERGLANLGKHLETVAAFGRPAVVALNGRAGDTPEEIAMIGAYAEAHGASFAASTHYMDGGAGALDLAETVVRAAAASQGPLQFLYPLDAPIPAKIEAIAKTAYGAASVSFTPAAKAAMKRCRDNGWDQLPICMAKTSASLSDNAKLRGRPRDFEVTVQDLRPSLGAGFLVALCGDISRMPGLPRRPAALDVDLVDGVIVGVE
jgi:formate--tetrahydrofolate ligase